MKPSTSARTSRTGPDPYPATVVDHDLRPGGHVSYYMTGPEGDQHKGYLRIMEVEPPHRLVYEDGFADQAGEPNDDLPVNRAEVTIDIVDDARTRMTIRSVYDTSADLEQVPGHGHGGGHPHRGRTDRRVAGRRMNPAREGRAVLRGTGGGARGDGGAREDTPVSRHGDADVIEDGRDVDGHVLAGIGIAPGWSTTVGLAEQEHHPDGDE
jgi:uncharacterized protein YndB with AHSA1/START domain